MQPSGALTTVLVSREEDEKHNRRRKKDSKRKKLQKYAKKKLLSLGRGGKKDTKTSDDELDSSDDETRVHGPRGAPFMKQYEDKKHLEHILDEQHYWSDPEEKTNIAGQDDVILILICLNTRL